MPFSGKELAHLSIRYPAPQGNVRTVRPTGELDLSTAPALRDLLRGNDAAPAARLIADLTAVTFMDTSALTELETSLVRSEADGGWLRLVYHQPAIGQMLRLTGLTRRFPRYHRPGRLYRPSGPGHSRPLCCRTRRSGRTRGWPPELCLAPRPGMAP